MKKENIKPYREDEDTIDFYKLLKEFWDERRFILKITLIFTSIGLFIAVFSQNLYTSSTTFVPLVEGKSAKSGLGGLASLAGINLNGGSNSEISPDLYPQIVKSIPFQKELLQTQLLIEGQASPVSYKWYYENLYSLGVLGNLKKYTLGLPSTIISLFTNDDKNNKITNLNDDAIISVSTEEGKLIKQYLEVNTAESFVTISVTMHEAYASSQLTLRAQELLQEYALKFKTEKSKDELKYIEARFLEKQKEFQEVQLNLARFEDQNNSINTSLGRTKLLQLKSDYNITFNVYNELAKQLETQRLQVKQDTPLFTVLKPVTIPLVKSSPRRLLNLVATIFVGFLFSLGLVKVKVFYNDFKKIKIRKT